MKQPKSDPRKAALAVEIRERQGRQTCTAWCICDFAWHPKDLHLLPAESDEYELQSEIGPPERFHKEMPYTQ